MHTSHKNVVHLPTEKWHPLTEFPRHTTEKATAKTTVESPQACQKVATYEDDPTLPKLNGLSAVLTKLLYDILVYLYSSVSVRIKRLGISARAFEKAKLDGCEKNLIFESAAGATIYLIPKPKTFEIFGFPCPYKRDVSTEHSYYVGWGHFLFQKDAAIKSVHSELKIGASNCTSDIVAVAHDGTRCAYEVTLSTINVLSNAAKYINTDFVRIVFLCRDYKLREAVRACCREGGLDTDLLAKLDYIQFSTLLRRQRKMSLY
jgi:hypothetical protein